MSDHFLQKYRTDTVPQEYLGGLPASKKYL